MSPFFDALCCPDDGASPLERREEAFCCPACARAFPYLEGIVTLRPSGRGPATPTSDEAAAVFREQRQRDREAGEYDRLWALRLLSVAEIPLTLRPLALGAGSRLVESGCGTGRLTQPAAATGARVIAIDHSRRSLEVLRRKLPGERQEQVLLVEGDAGRLPVRSGWATHALSGQMLEHLPSDRLRAAAVEELARVLAPGGRLALSVYRYLPALRLLLPREGRHSGEIFFHRFMPDELHRLLAPHFELERLSGSLLYLLLAHGTGRTGRSGP